MNASTVNAPAAVICPSCGEVYDSADRVRDVVFNSGFCVKLTCLEDLSSEPFDAILSMQSEGKRASDRRAS